MILPYKWYQHITPPVYSEASGKMIQECLTAEVQFPTISTVKARNRTRYQNIKNGLAHSRTYNTVMVTTTYNVTEQTLSLQFDWMLYTASNVVVYC